MKGVSLSILNCIIGRKMKEKDKKLLLGALNKLLEETEEATEEWFNFNKTVPPRHP